VEKPDRTRAEEYLRAGNFYWNSGMFIWSVKTFQKALARHRPELLHMADRILPVVGTPEFDRRLGKEYADLENISVDYAIMEKADNIVMAKGLFRWSDVGCWPALEDHFDRDSSDNVVIGTCESMDSEGNVIVSEDRLTALIGVRDLVVVQAENATLVCAKNRAQDVKEMVKLLTDKGKYGDVL